MFANSLYKSGILIAVSIALAGCSGGLGGGGGLFSGGNSNKEGGLIPAHQPKEPEKRATIWDLFSNAEDPNTSLEVNKYIWNASLDVLNFLPIQAADPFSGVITTGYGTPPGGGRAYRATIFVRDPALDARSLSLSLQTRSGPVSRATVQAVEDAILTRARQLRVADGRL